MSQIGSMTIDWRAGAEAPDVCIHRPEFVRVQHIEGTRHTSAFSTVTLDADGVPVRLFLDPETARRVAEAFQPQQEAPERAAAG